MRLCFLLCCSVVTVLSVLTDDCLRADDWPQFLGPQRTGVSAETGLTATLPESGPVVVWRQPLGVGMSGMTVHSGLVCTLFQDVRQQYVIALDEQTGAEKWKTAVADALTNPMGNGPRATPAVVDGAVYAYTGDGTLVALKAETGELQWSVKTVRDLQAKQADYGMASSPLVVDEHVVVHVGAQQGTVAAYRCDSGDLVWATGRQKAGYSSPVLMDIAGVPQIISFVGASLMGISPTDGRELWSYSFPTAYDCNIAVPVQLSDSVLLISAGEDQGSAALELIRSDDDWSVKENWSSFGGGSVLRSEWQTPVLHGDYLFGLDNLGSAGPITSLVCVNANTGEQLWKERRFGKSNLTLADGKLFLSTMDGELVIVTATEQGFTETARSEVLGMTRQAPVIANGRLYLRDDKEIVCLDIRAQQ